MFFFVARLRLLAAFFLLAPFAFAREESLFTSSVTYCSPPETLLIQQFFVQYFPANRSVSFNISAASVESNLNVSANVFLNVYGMHPLNFTLDLCSIFHNALCPLPQYNFTGTDSIVLPASVDVTDKLPGVAFKIPDLEAFAQLTLVEVGTGEVKACVQSTLANGWSTHQVGVEWATGAVAILALLSATWQSFSPDALAPYRFLDLIYLYQTISTTALLDLNYSSVYRSFTMNFAWAIGLFTSNHVQNSINHMRHLTGGSMADSTGGSAVGLVNRALSPYNEGIAVGTSAMEQSLLALSDLHADYSSFSGPGSSIAAYASPLMDPTELDVNSVETVTSASSNVLQAGVPIYVNTINIATANAFMTVFLTALMLAAIALALMVLLYGGLVALSRYHRSSRDRVAGLKRRYPSFVKAWWIRFWLVVFTPITVFAFYQWSLKDSWLSIFISVISFVCLVAFLSFWTLRIMRTVRRDRAESLYTDSALVAVYGPLYAQYRSPRFYFYILPLTATVVRAVLIAAAQDHGEVQLILLILLEAAVVVAQVLLKPHPARGGDVLGAYLALTRLAATALMVGFLERLALAAIPRVAIGIVIAVLFSIAVIVLFVNTLLHLGVRRLWRTRAMRRIPSQQGTPDGSIIEKYDAEKAGGADGARPALHTYPMADGGEEEAPQPSPVRSSTEGAEAHDDSGSLMHGSLLPRRWSAYSQPPRTPLSATTTHSQQFLSARSSPVDTPTPSHSPVATRNPHAL